VAGECGHDHGVVTRIGAFARSHIRVRIDPQNRQLIAVHVDQVRERRHAHRALAAEGRDACRIVFTNDLQGGAELVEEDSLRLDAVALLESRIAHLDRNDSGRTIVLRKYGLEHLGAH
jgi:hypothetical protein